MSQAVTQSALIAAQVGAAGGTPSAKATYPTPHVAGGKLRLYHIAYQPVSSTLPAAGDIVELVKLHNGAKVIPSLSSIVCPATGTTLTVKIGDYSNAVRYAGVIGTAAGLVLSAASSGVGSGAILFGKVPSIECFVPRAIDVQRGLPVPWVTGTVYQVNQQVTVAALTYTCQIAHTSGTFATDLTNLNWILSGDHQSWVTSTAYVIGDTVVLNAGATAAAAPTNLAITYICITAHTSGTFATDLAAAKWLAVSGDEATVIMTIASISTLTQGTPIMINLVAIDE